MAELKVLDAEPVGADVIEKLEEALALARENRLSAVALATVDRAGMAGNSWSKTPSLSTLIGSVARLQAALIRKADGGD